MGKKSGWDWAKAGRTRFRSIEREAWGVSVTIKAKRGGALHDQQIFIQILTCEVESTRAEKIKIGLHRFSQVYRPLTHQPTLYILASQNPPQISFFFFQTNCNFLVSSTLVFPISLRGLGEEVCRDAILVFGSHEGWTVNCVCYSRKEGGRGGLCFDGKLEK